MKLLDLNWFASAVLPWALCIMLLPIDGVASEAGVAYDAVAQGDVAERVVTERVVEDAAESSTAPAGYTPCIACHGQQGEGNSALQAPALAGQDAAYLERQLQHFKSGLRGTGAQDTLGAQMRAMAIPLPDSAFPEIAQWLAQLPAPVVEAAGTGDLRNGNNYYQANCGVCHGSVAQGNSALNAPALAQLDAAYLKRQYQLFQSGNRGSHLDDKYGRQMQMMSSTLPDEKALDDVIAFIHSLAANP